VRVVFILLLAYRIAMGIKDPMDTYVGQRLKLRRGLAGMTQEGLAKLLDVSFQMVQKYENGTSRLTAGRLSKVAQSLGVPVSWFFEGYKPVKNSKIPSGLMAGLAEEATNLDESHLNSKETLELLKLYYTLPEAMRKNVVGMMKGVDWSGGSNKAKGKAPSAEIKSIRRA
jgi:transcriptional regulator with XRE-family HTH domain